ncbi:PAS domain S-box protein [Salinimicrobium sp. HB62]|uniref:PAS domain S-box protein n=1 Tax=Salinimicrobium sp. HB62 TaxID=3077781 RepID=UPI002D7A0CF6|nr:PAS domain S-box protein [Salinimicrobium sp. HB62]
MDVKTRFFKLLGADEKLFDFVQEEALDGLWFWDLENRNQLYISPKLLKILGYTIQPPGWENIIDREELEIALENHTSENAAPHSPLDQSLKLKAFDGAASELGCKTLIIFGKDRKPVGMLGAYNEIIKLAAKEKELFEAKEKAEKSEMRYRTLFENMNTGFVLFEVVKNRKDEPVDLLILAANKRFEETTGLNLRAAVGSHLSKALPGIENDEADWIGTYSRVAMTGKPIRYEQSSEFLGVHYSISAFPAEPGQCAVTFLDITERKQAEKLLAESEERLRLATEQSDVAVWEYDFVSHSITRSGNHDKLYGLEWQTKWDMNTFLEATHPEDRELSEQHIMGSVNPGGPDNYSFNFRVIYPDQTVRWLAANGKVIQRDEKGVGVRLRGTLADITEVKETELALRESELRFRMAIKHAPFPILIHAEDGQVIKVNSSWTRLTGYKERDIPTIARWTKKAYGTEKKTIKKYIEGLYTLNAPKAEGEYKIRTKSGEYRIWEFSSGPIGELPDGRRLVISMAMDVTERKKAELDLFDTSQLLKTSQEIAHLGSFEYKTADGSMVWSEEEYRIYGLDPASPAPDLSELLQKFIHPADRILFEKTFTTAMQNHEDFALEHRIIRPDNGIRWVYSKAHPTFKEQGILLAYVGATLDITERKQLQEDLEKLNAELEQKVKQRTLLLEASNKELEAFSYSVSHDLRAPLRHINGYVDLLNRRYYKDLPEKAQHYLQIISAASSKMGSLIDDLLEYSKTGRTEVRKAEIDLNVLLKEIKEELGIEEKKERVLWEVQKLPKVFGDASLLKLVWRNLLENALKYSGKKVISKISVSYVEEEEYFVFSIQDNGVGFDMKYAQKLFGVFQRLHSQADFEGTGIGLANVQRIIQKHSGRVWAEAEVGKGAVFHFSLPKHQKEIA